MGWWEGWMVGGLDSERVEGLVGWVKCGRGDGRVDGLVGGLDGGRVG